MREETFTASPRMSCAALDDVANVDADAQLDLFFAANTLVPFVHFLLDRDGSTAPPAGHLQTPRGTHLQSSLLHGRRTVEERTRIRRCFLPANEERALRPSAQTK